MFTFTHTLDYQSEQSLSNNRPNIFPFSWEYYTVGVVAHSVLKYIVSNNIWSWCFCCSLFERKRKQFIFSLIEELHTLLLTQNFFYFSEIISQWPDLSGQNYYWCDLFAMLALYDCLWYNSPFYKQMHPCTHTHTQT